MAAQASGIAEKSGEESHVRTTETSNGSEDVKICIAVAGDELRRRASAEGIAEFRTKLLAGGRPEPGQATIEFARGQRMANDWIAIAVAIETLLGRHGFEAAFHGPVGLTTRSPNAIRSLRSW